MGAVKLLTVVLQHYVCVYKRRYVYLWCNYYVMHAQHVFFNDLHELKMFLHWEENIASKLKI